MTDHFPPVFIPLPQRGFLSVSGEDAGAFLQGLITNDIRKVSENQGIYALMLTPQGKYLYEFYITKTAEGYLLDVPAADLAAIRKKLNLYKLRSRVAISEPEIRLAAAALPFPGALDGVSLPHRPGAFTEQEGARYLADPRTAALGLRVIAPEAGMAALKDTFGYPEAPFEQYEIRRIRLGVPDASRDMDSEKSFPLQYLFDEFHAIDYEKGCYVGQEVTARTHWRGVARKRLVRVHGEHPLPPKGTELIANGKTVGELTSLHSHDGLALVELEPAQAAAHLTAGGVILRLV